MAIVLRQINEPVPRLSDVVPRVDRWISDWIAWLVSKEPTDRPQSAAEAWDALEELLIAQLGPRWRHGAQLLEPGERPAATLSERPTRRQVDPRLAATVPPRRPLPEAAPARRPLPPSPEVAQAAPAGGARGRRARSRREAGRADDDLGDAAPSRALHGRIPRDTADRRSRLRRRRRPVRRRTRGTWRCSQTASHRRRSSRATTAARPTGSRSGRAARARTRSSSPLSARVARDYRAAAAAAERGDLAGYTDAVTAANAGAKAVAGKLDAAERPRRRRRSRSPTQSTSRPAQHAAGRDTSLRRPSLPRRSLRRARAPATRPATTRATTSAASSSAGRAVGCVRIDRLQHLRLVARRRTGRVGLGVGRVEEGARLVETQLVAAPVLLGRPLDVGDPLAVALRVVDGLARGDAVRP